MGTSAAYSAPPSWGDLKTDVTRGAGAGSLGPDKARELVQSFIDHNGGATAISRGVGRRGGSVAKGKSARAAAARLGGFIADAGRVGLEQALRDAGWDDLVGRPVEQILSALLDRLGGDATTIDDVDARMALARFQEKYFADATSVQELEDKLTEQAPNLDAILLEYFGFYLYEVFCRVFFERLVQRVGETRANSFLGQIGDFISSALANATARQQVSKIDWAGEEGSRITSDIMEATLNVFGGG